MSSIRFDCLCSLNTHACMQRTHSWVHTHTTHARDCVRGRLDTHTHIRWYCVRGRACPHHHQNITGGSLFEGEALLRVKFYGTQPVSDEPPRKLCVDTLPTVITPTCLQRQSIHTTGYPPLHSPIKGQSINWA